MAQVEPEDFGCGGRYDTCRRGQVGARASLSAGQGAGTLAFDLSRSRAANPLWLRHAHFHLVWQATSFALLSLIE
jgi:hypothetical protein